MRLIDADALSELVGEPIEVFLGRLDLKLPPTVDAVPVRHGRWTKVGHIEHMLIVYKCSVCNGDTIVDGDFCPNCGARMDKDE